MLKRLRDVVGGPLTAPADASPHRTAIIDIGSNSIRLVVYDGPRRVPFILFNEKVMAGLGASLDKTGAISDVAMDRGIAALARFRELCRHMEVASVRCVATAAVRDASNGPAFMQRVESLGLSIELLSGRQEGEASGYGVLSAIPDADGIVGDLGGGSLELVRIKGGQVHAVTSLPLGVLRLAQIRDKGRGALERRVKVLLKEAGWNDVEPGLPLYMVGGSWRSLARLDMHLTGFPLPIINQYAMAPDRASHLVRVLAQMDKDRIKDIPSISTQRIPTLREAAALLAVLVRLFKSGGLVASAYGLREGLLYAELSEEQQRIDPLLAAAKGEGESQGRFAGHGALIDRWIAPLFEADPPEMARIRVAACLLADVGWRANPEFRAERGLEIALHGNWVGIDVAGRAMLAQALYACLGGGTAVLPDLAKAADPVQLARAIQWGLAIRLGQRLSGGVAEPLRHGGLSFANGHLRLSLRKVEEGLYGESVERRLRRLATSLSVPYEVDIL